MSAPPSPRGDARGSATCETCGKGWCGHLLAQTAKAARQRLDNALQRPSGRDQEPTKGKIAGAPRPSRGGGKSGVIRTPKDAARAVNKATGEVAAPAKRATLVHGPNCQCIAHRARKA